MDTAAGPTRTAATSARSRARFRRTLPRPLAYALAAYVIALGLFAALAPTPLYGIYSGLWDFSAVTLTLIYATYAFGVLATLVLAGSVSDDVGRRPVLLVALAVLMASTAVFFFATSAAWLFVARGLQGLATGAVISAASAAMLDLHPRRDPWGVSLANGVASAAGITFGVLVVSVLVQLAPSPRMLPYAVLLAMIAIAFVGAWWMPEPVSDRRALRLTVAWPHVPTSVRGPFLLAGLTTVASWSLGGLFFSLGPQLGARVFGTSNAVIAGIGIVALGTAAALGQLALGRTPPWLAACLGSVALAVGAVLIVIATGVNSSGLYVLGSVIVGVGFGIGFLGGLRALVGSIPPEHRASVMSAFYIVAYASLSVPAVVAGLVVGRLGLETTFEAFAVVVVLITLVTAIVAVRTRPRPAPRSSTAT